jgi:hypothetical protein
VYIAREVTPMTPRGHVSVERMVTEQWHRYAQDILKTKFYSASWFWQTLLHSKAGVRSGISRPEPADQERSGVARAPFPVRTAQSEYPYLNR